MAEADPSSPVTWDADGAPRSRAFGDVYFSKVDGLAESRAVFLAGCGLPDAWAGRERFTVAELGFGSGLNILALLDLWRRSRPPAGRLHIFSVEAFPMTAQDAGRALAARGPHPLLDVLLAGQQIAVLDLPDSRLDDAYLPGQRVAGQSRRRAQLD